MVELFFENGYYFSKKASSYVKQGPKYVTFVTMTLNDDRNFKEFLNL